MDKIKINTQTVFDVASQISSYNQEIDNEFENVKNAINNLSCNWSGSASEKAMEKFGQIKSQYVENSETSRHKVIEDYVKILKQSVGTGYEKAEDVNTQLAEAFK